MSDYPTPQPRPPDTIYRDALIAARDYSTDALLSFADAFRATAVDEAPDFPGPTGRILAQERLRAIRDELARRERLSRIQRGVASPADLSYQAWRDLATAVRDRADMLRILDICGYDYRKDSERESHAACPVCGGVDRLVITAGPPDLVWCRRCHWGGDAITVTMSLRGESFRDAVRFLAEVYGEETP